MKTLVAITSTLLVVIVYVFGYAQEERDANVINTYWHHLDGPNWIYKAKSISISGSYIYAFGSDKDSQFKISLSTDNGQTWSA